MADTHWANVTFLVNFTAGDGNTAPFDESDDTRAITVAGGASIQSGELELDGSDDYISIANSAALVDPTGAFTVELLLTPDTITGPGWLFATSDSGYSGGINIARSGGKIQVDAYDGADGEVVFIWDAGEAAYLSVDTEYHVEVSRDGSGDWRLFVDGVQRASTTSESGAVGGGDSTAYIGAWNGSASFFDGSIDAIRITNGVARNTSNFTAPTELVADRDHLAAAWTPTPLGAPEAVIDEERLVIVASPSPLGAPEVLSEAYIPAIVSVPSPLSAPYVVTENDFSGFTAGVPYKYLMRVTGSPELTIPISSWQATLQTDREQYVQCTVPAVDDYVSDLTDRLNTEELVIYRSVEIGGADVEVEVARTTLESMVLYQGPYRYTATLSGYSAAFSGPSTYPTKTLSGIRLITQTVGGNVRVRSDIDWLLRPGNTVDADGLEITATYINYYSTTDGLEYMDVGTR